MISNSSSKTTSSIINESVSETTVRGGILSKISNVFKRKKKNATTTVEKFLSAKNPDSNSKGQWYEQGKQKRITK